MSDRQLINIAALTICAVVCVILLVFSLISGNRKDKPTRIFILMLYLHTALLLIDIPIFLFEGSGEPYAGLVIRAAAFFSFGLGTIYVTLVISYVMAVLEFKGGASRRAVYASRAVLILCGVNLIGVMLTPFFDMFYFIDRSNFLRYGNLYWLNQLWAGACAALFLGVVISQRKVLGTRTFIFFMSYTVLPILAIFVHNALMEGVNASYNVANALKLLIFYVGIQNEVQSKLKQNELDARIGIMLSQIRPHFLYNSLTSIQRLCQKDPKLAEEAVAEFAQYLRGNIDSLSHKEPIHFENELNHTESYLAIEKKRFGEKLNIAYHITARDFSLPALTLQPIAENAVKHGVTKRKEGGTVTISTAETETDFVIIITDDGIGFNVNGKLKMENGKLEDGRRHVGIENVRSRLAAMCGGTLTISSKPGKGTTAVITIPKRSCDRK